MPNCFQLIRKTDGKAEALVKVDEQICALLSVPVHPVKYCCYWFDHIGFPVAMGKSLQQVKDDLLKEEDQTDKHVVTMLKIVEFLIINYTTDAWVQIGK